MKGVVKRDGFLAQACVSAAKYTKEGYYSEGLQDFALKYASIMSFSNTSDLVKEVTGGAGISDQHIWNLVQAQAQDISRAQQEQISAFKLLELKVEAAAVDIYDRKAEEILYLSDDIGVKKQKEKRDKVLKTNKERCNTRISMFTDASHKSHTLVAGIGIDNCLLVQASIWEHHRGKIHALPIVAITDGATSIKNEVKSAFGEKCVHILDWYHLEKKVYGTMSMIAHRKEEKSNYCKEIVHLLWRGKVAEAIDYIQQIQPKNQESKEMLLTYLKKNQTSIINYEKRKENGKTIGSGKCEKQNDLIVAKRQKHNGMSWSINGSLSMALNTANRMT